MENQVLKNGDYVFSKTGSARITQGKIFKVGCVNLSYERHGVSFHINNEGTDAYCLFRGCAWLGGDNWTIVSYKNILQIGVIIINNFFKKLFKNEIR